MSDVLIYRGEFAVAVRGLIGWRVVSDYYGHTRNAWRLTRRARDRELRRQAARVRASFEKDGKDRSVSGRPESDRFNVALCPIHGLHGRRTECFVCGGPVEQVPVRATGKYRGRKWPI